jgi:Phage integrase, N-terminal SAM-like domain/Phage integrase family
MTELRQRMIECLQLRGLSARTQEMSVRAVRQLAEPYHKSPDVITEEELRQDFLYIQHVKQYSRRASTIALCGIKFFFEQTLHRDWTTLRFVRAPREKKLPVILSFEEVRRLLGCVRLPRDRVCLSTLDSCGLRLQEGTHLHVQNIDSARQLIQVRHGKGGKDRDCPLATMDTGTASPVLDHASPSSLDLPGAGAWEDRLVDRHRPDAQEQRSGCVQGSPPRQRHPPARVGAHAATFRGHPCAGGWRQSSAHSSVSRAPLSHDHERLHTPDGQS